MRFNKGFTLIEMLVVIIIIGILFAIALPTYSIINRVSAVKSTSTLVNVALAEARMLSTETRVRHIVRFFNYAATVGVAEHGRITVHKDRNNNNTPEDNEQTSPEPRKFPAGVIFVQNPQYVLVEPTGFLNYYPPSYPDVQPSQLSATAGDIIVKSTTENYYMSMDINRPACKITRAIFIKQ